MNPADDWDRAAYENMLVDLAIGGRMRKALIQTGKMGWGVVLDRTTGEFLHAFKTAYDNVVTGWTPKGRPIVNPATVPTASRRRFRQDVRDLSARARRRATCRRRATARSPGCTTWVVNNCCMDAKVVAATYVPGRAYVGVSYTPKFAPGYDYVGEFVAFNPATGDAGLGLPVGPTARR